MECAGKRKQDPICLLVTLDENYLFQLQILLSSIAVNNFGESIQLYLMHSGIPEEKLKPVKQQCDALGYSLDPVFVDQSLFQNAPVTKRYPQEMYYRLFAPRLLPDSLDKILYLDPDILVINPLRPLWEMDLGQNLFAAASHTGLTEIANDVNRVRLKTENAYFNSGVLLMNLALCRTEVVPEEVFAFSAQHKANLLLPDQDILNAMFGNRILPLEDSIWNYDARNYNSYRLRSSGKMNQDWVLAHTAILHFCGGAKPWKPGYPYRFGILYKHYAQLTRTWFGKEDAGGTKQA